MPREGLKPGAVVEEGGKQQLGRLPWREQGGAWSQGRPTRGPPRPTCTCSELAKRAWLHSLPAPGPGACLEARRAHFISLLSLAPPALDLIPPQLPTAEFRTEAPARSSCLLPFDSEGPGCALCSPVFWPELPLAPDPMGLVAPVVPRTSPG